ncbi:hybrid sensor histidine kinase/response regulator [Lysobacter sp. TY2-98]|uniref:hybrid sensor histidine kinase/response regulator n=1 Tax=Lysobacter sp. TY2-98 TaxID=2290922 RepID=UPI0019643AFD|nr:hybrid sensor histidine kinase/response regulator [Lysobacter sp. TY2-98]
MHLSLLLPTPRDTELTARILNRAGVVTRRCSSLADLDPSALLRSGAVMVGEEWLSLGALGALRTALEQQPAWSDLPILIVARAGVESGEIGAVLESLGNATLIDRPMRIATLTSAARAALRARERQYQICSQLSALERAGHEQAMAAERKDEFLAMLGHELRNPLAPIRNALHMLRQLGLGGPTEQQLLDIMQRQTDHMVRLVEDLVDVARLTRGTMEMRRAPVMLDALIESALELSRPLMVQAGHEVSVTIEPRGMIVDADRVRMTQVFSNLLNNAAKYSGPHARIVVRVHRDGADAVVEVKDTGLGIEADVLPRVFDLFVQGPREPGQVNDGLGIGLALVKRLVQLHDGSVTARSEGEGAGSTFEVRLPVAQVGAWTEGGPEPARAVGAYSRSLRILVVDDNRDSAETLGLLLETLEIDNRVVFDGRSALRAVESYRPTAVFLDIGMPGMDGYEVARRIRELAVDARPRLIALTGWSQLSDQARTREAGFDFHMSKPADFAELQRILELLSHPSRAEVAVP